MLTNCELSTALITLGYIHTDLGWNILLVIIVGEGLFAEGLIAMVEAEIAVEYVACADQRLRTLCFASLHNEEHSHVELTLVTQQWLDELAVTIRDWVHCLEDDSNSVLPVNKTSKQARIPLNYLLATANR